MMEINFENIKEVIELSTTFSLNGKWVWMGLIHPGFAELIQRGDKIEGTYTYEEKHMDGQGALEGTIEGLYLKGTYADPYYSGNFSFTINGNNFLDGKSSQGPWRMKRADLSGNWRWSGSFYGGYMSLVQTGSKITGTYNYFKAFHDPSINSYIEGTIVENYYKDRKTQKDRIIGVEVSAKYNDHWSGERAFLWSMRASELWDRLYSSKLLPQSMDAERI